MKVSLPKSFSILLIMLLFFLSATGCKQGDLSVSAHPESEWSHVKAIPFSGYICGTENATAHIQLLFLGNPASDLSGAQIEQVCMRNVQTGETFPCKLSNILPGSRSENWRLYTLALFIELPATGLYSANQVELKFRTGESVLLDQGKIEIDVLPSPGKPSLFSTKIQLNSDSCNLVNITYQNMSAAPLTVLDIEAGSLFSGIKSMTVSSTEGQIDSATISSGEQKSFLFELVPEENAFQTIESQFFLMLPKLKYETLDGSIFYIPAQSQATTVYPDFVTEYLDSLFCES